MCWSISTLKPTSSPRSWEQRDKLVGISPLSELLFNRRCCNLCRRLNSGGITRPKLFASRSMTLKKLKFPTCGGIDPASFKDGRLKLVTLLWRRPHVTPCQEQKWMVSFHEVRTLKGSWVMLALISSKASLSVSFPGRAKQGRQEWRMKACIKKDEKNTAEMEL